MPFYKFMDQQYVDGFVNGGIIKISRLSYYRRLEIESGSRWIGDKDEGTARFTHEPMEIDMDKYNRGEATAVEKSMVKAIVGDTSQMWGSISFFGNTIKSLAPDIHIWCFSEGDLSSLLEAMNNCGMPSEFRYNAAIEISDPKEIAQSIVNGVVKDCNGRRVSQLFGSVLCGKIEYSGHDRVLSDSGFDVDPFTKDKFFSHQKEWRVATKTARSDLPDSVFVKLHEHKRVIRGVHFAE